MLKCPELKCRWAQISQAQLSVRPPLKRETIVAWIEYCSHCGYRIHNISDQQGVTQQRKMVLRVSIIYTLGITQGKH